MMRVVALLFASGLYWQLVCQITGMNEPWDSHAYWPVWYPLSLLLSAIAGYLCGRTGWLAGLVVTFAQVPVLWINAGGPGAMAAAGMLFLCILAIPAVAISAIAGRLGVCRRSA